MQFVPLWTCVNVLLSVVNETLRGRVFSSSKFVVSKGNIGSYIVFLYIGISFN